MSAVSSSDSVRERVSQARQAVAEAKRAVQAAQDEMLLAATSFDIAMLHQMDTAIALIKRDGKESLTNEIVVEVVAHYLSKGYQDSWGMDEHDYDIQRVIIKAFANALSDSHPWITLHARRGVVIEVTLPQDGDYAKAMPYFLGDFFFDLDRYVLNSEIDSDRRPVIIFKDAEERNPVFIQVAKGGGFFSLNPVLLELEAPIGVRTFEEVVKALPSLVQKSEEAIQATQKKPWWKRFPLAA